MLARNHMRIKAGACAASMLSKRVCLSNDSLRRHRSSTAASTAEHQGPPGPHGMQAVGRGYVLFPPGDQELMGHGWQPGAPDKLSYDPGTQTAR